MYKYMYVWCIIDAIRMLMRFLYLCEKILIEKISRFGNISNYIIELILSLVE